MNEDNALLNGVFYGMLIWFVVLALLSIAHCTTTVKHENSMGFVQYTTNPFTYVVGNMSEGFDIENGKGLVVRIQPAGTYALFTMDILLCGTPTEKFAGKANPLVLTYETQAHRAIEGIGCHRLVNVQELKIPKEKLE